MKRVLAVFTSIALSLQLSMSWMMNTTVAAGVGFTDTEHHWAEKEIERLRGKGWIGGYSDGTFRPDANVTRAEFTLVLTRALQLNAAGAGTDFADVPKDHWAANAIAAGQVNGLLGGYPDGTFRPDRSITRAEAVSVLMKAYAYDPSPDQAVSFRDVTSDHWAFRAIMMLAGDEIVLGDTQGRFHPDLPVKRAELAVLLLRTIDRNIAPLARQSPPPESEPVTSPPSTGGTGGSGGGGGSSRDKVPPANVHTVYVGFTSNSASFSWTNPADNDFRHVAIYRDGMIVGTSADGTFYDTGLAPDSTYSYRIAAVDAAGNESSGIVKNVATKPLVLDADETEPTQVIGLTAAAASATSIRLVWSPAMDPIVPGRAQSGVAGYYVYGEDNSIIATVTDETYMADNLAAERRYRFKVAAFDAAGNIGEVSEPIAVQGGVYELDPAAWGIYSDGTHAKETTDGFNKALAWAHAEGYTVFKVPAGTYLIHKPAKNVWGSDGHITLVPNMTFWADDRAVFQKETNDSEGYSTLLVPYGADNVVIRGGTYRGDKETHRYAVKDTYGPGTHENGVGIKIAGAKNVTIVGVKAVNFTGDGAFVGGQSTLIQDLYEGSFTSGNITGSGQLVKDTSAIRTREAVTLSPERKPMFAEEKHFELSNPHYLPGTFDIYFYRADGSFLTRQTSVPMREKLSIPEHADHFHLVFHKSDAADAYVEVWNRVQSDNVVITNSEFAFNRRQGITVAGGNNVLIMNNSIHDIGGTAPMSGIDVEGGYGENGMLNSNIFIKENDFFNNERYDVILYDGHDAVVEGNRLGSKGVFGLAVSAPFTGATIKDNHFDGSRIIGGHDVTFIGNTMNDSLANFEGPNVLLDGFEFTDSQVSISANVPYGVELKNVTMRHTKSAQSGVGFWREPVKATNLTIIGESQLGVIGGSGKDGSIFENLILRDTSGGNLPRGTYNGCVIESGTRGGVQITLDGVYALNECSFKGNGTLLSVHHTDAVVTVTDSVFENTGDLHTIDVLSGKRFVFRNNTVTANYMVRTDLQIVKINDYWQRNDPYDIEEVIIEGNTIVSNIAARGISTMYAGVGAPPYVIRNNVLRNAVLFLKENDINDTNVNNRVLPADYR